MKNEKDAKRLVVNHEGRRALVYRDSLGHPTIGVGFNLDRSGAPQALAAIGVDYNAVAHNGVALTDQQIDELFEADFAKALESATIVCPSFNGLSEGAQAVLVDMAFQLGIGDLRQFHNFLMALEAKDYATAAYEMCNSKLAIQTPHRVVDNVMGLLRPLRQVA